MNVIRLSSGWRIERDDAKPLFLSFTDVRTLRNLSECGALHPGAQNRDGISVGSKSVERLSRFGLVFARPDGAIVATTRGLSIAYTIRDAP